MEVTSTSNPQPIQPRRNGDDRIDLTRVNRDGIREATEDIAEIRAPQEPYAVRMKRQAGEATGNRSKEDQIELSPEARKLLEEDGKVGATADERRAKRLDELRQRYLEGRLSTPERAERAAVRMLESS